MDTFNSNGSFIDVVEIVYTVPVKSVCNGIPVISPVDVSKFNPSGNCGEIDIESGFNPVNVAK
ncbi:MAG: Uncharacterised protein [Methanobacteriota archaeon]|nr:MAG: Uncharacterised protein [Euryarchaeota archaeon]